MAKKEIKKETPKRRVQLSFTLQKSVNDKFLSYCNENLINKSLQLESLIIAFMDSKDFAGMIRKE